MAKVMVVANGKIISFDDYDTPNDALEAAEDAAFDLTCNGHAAALYDNMTGIPGGMFESVVSPEDSELTADVLI